MEAISTHFYANKKKPSYNNNLWILNLLSAEAFVYSPHSSMQRNVLSIDLHSVRNIASIKKKTFTEIL